MGISLTYTRPKHVGRASFRRSQDSLADSKTEGSVRSGQSGCSAGVPDSLAFDNIINGGTCPPMTVRDFMNYLIYVEHSAENLQFYLWYRDYVKRFVTANTADLALAPEWTQAMEDESVAKIRKDHIDKLKPEPQVAVEMFKGTDFEKPARDNGGINPFNTPPHTPPIPADQESIHTEHTAVQSTVASSYKSQAADAFSSAGAKLPFTVQPFREEINRIVATYIMDGAPRQLNLSAWEQRAAVQALSNTTHPTALRLLIKSAESTLRRQAHPNFVRWSIANGNPARVFFARVLGVGVILIGVIAGLLMTLGGVSRGLRALSAIPFVLGVSTLVAAYKGMCVVLHGMHHRHVRPWELFVHDVDDDEESNEKRSGLSQRSFESLGSSNSYEDEPWVVKYEKRNIVRKVFDREVWIQEPALRQIQDTIFIQAILASVLFGGALTALFVALPGWNYF